MKLVQAIHDLRLEDEEVPDNVTHFIPVTKNHITMRKWAADNAYTLGFLTVMFFITDLIFFLTHYGVI